MINLKPIVKAALENDPTLSNLIAGRVYFYGVPSPAVFPCVTYYEQSNIPGLKGDSRELTTESVMVIDVWSKGSTTAIAQAVDNIMAGLHFVREFAGDLYENDTKVYHKSMRYRNKSRRY